MVTILRYMGSLFSDSTDYKAWQLVPMIPDEVNELVTCFCDERKLDTSYDNYIQLKVIGVDFLKKSALVTLVFLLILSIRLNAQESFYMRLSESAIELTRQIVKYDPAYYTISYPNGDIPTGKGVCTDVIIRAYRKLGIDLQKEVHEDMKLNFGKYPKIWGMSKTDKNIDHRRVPNLMVFFERHGCVKPITGNPIDYQPGDIVCWNLGGAVTHIGIVVNRKSRDGKRYLIVHNIGDGQVMEDCLFDFRIIGHYRYQKEQI